MTKIEEIKRIFTKIDKLFPYNGIEFSVNDDKTNYEVIIRETSYDKASKLLSDLGARNRNKIVFETFTVLSGDVDGIKFKSFPDELPPTCRKEKYIERIPKVETIDTGEFIEVERTKIVCGKDEQ